MEMGSNSLYVWNSLIDNVRRHELLIGTFTPTKGQKIAYILQVVLML
jgi:hypothetical protein